MLMCRLAILLNSFNELNKANQHKITIYYTFVYHIFSDLRSTLLIGQYRLFLEI